ncbi:MAG: hypothetical protein HYU39_09820 [Thaumarchaeota archaeon]|nr:hypothetical protein [Nitrososphaerota archaeon]
MTVLIGEGDGIVGKRIIYVARKVEGPHLVRKSGSHRGLLGELYDAEVYIDLPIEKGSST